MYKFRRKSSWTGIQNYLLRILFHQKRFLLTISINGQFFPVDVSTVSNIIFAPLSIKFKKTTVFNWDYASILMRYFNVILLAHFVRVFIINRYHIYCKPFRSQLVFSAGFHKIWLLVDWLIFLWELYNLH